MFALKVNSGVLRRELNGSQGGTCPVSCKIMALAGCTFVPVERSASATFLDCPTWCVKNPCSPTVSKYMKMSIVPVSGKGTVCGVFYYGLLGFNPNPSLSVEDLNGCKRKVYVQPRLLVAVSSCFDVPLDATEDYFHKVVYRMQWWVPELYRPSKYGGPEWISIVKIPTEGLSVVPVRPEPLVSTIMFHYDRECPYYKFCKPLLECTADVTHFKVSVNPMDRCTCVGGGISSTGGYNGSQRPVRVTRVAPGYWNANRRVTQRMVIDSKFTKEGWSANPPGSSFYQWYLTGVTLPIMDGPGCRARSPEAVLCLSMEPRHTMVCTSELTKFLKGASMGPVRHAREFVDARWYATLYGALKVRHKLPLEILEIILGWLTVSWFYRNV